MSAGLEEQSAHAPHFALLFHKDFKILIDDGDGQQDSGARADGAEEVRHYRQPTDAQAAEGSGGGDVPASQSGQIRIKLHIKLTAPQESEVSLVWRRH